MPASSTRAAQVQPRPRAAPRRCGRGAALGRLQVNRARCLPSLAPQVGKDKLTVRYNGPAQHDNDVGSIQAGAASCRRPASAATAAPSCVPTCSPAPAQLRPARRARVPASPRGRAGAAAQPVPHPPLPCGLSLSSPVPQSNHPVPRRCLVYYFEVAVKEASGGSITLGFSDRNFKQGRHPG